jgi:hypothetical protein
VINTLVPRGSTCTSPRTPAYFPVPQLMASTPLDGDSGSLGVGVHALYVDFPARQGVRDRTLRHVGLLVGLIGGVCYDAEQVEAPHFLGCALVVERGVEDAHIAVGGPFWFQVDGLDLAGLGGQDGEGTLFGVGGVRSGGAYGSQDT